MRLHDSRYEELKEKVAEVYEKLNINKLPVDAFQIATKLGIRVIPYSATPYRHIFMKNTEDGFCCQAANTYSIQYNIFWHHF